MVLVSVLHDALKTMYNAEKRGKRQVLIRPSSKVVIKFLQVMMKHGELHSFLTRLLGNCCVDLDRRGLLLRKACIPRPTEVSTSDSSYISTPWPAL